MTQLFEGVGIALSSLRANKLRAGLTILGIAIGVMVVMVIGSMISGINGGVADIFEQLGARTFFVQRSPQTGIVLDDDEWRRSPALTVQEAVQLEALPTISLVVIYDETSREVEFENKELTSVRILGQSAGWPRVSGGDIYPGRSYTELEASANSRVAVINEKLSHDLFGLRDPLGHKIRIGGVPFRVIGIYQAPPDLFGQQNRPAAFIPEGAFAKHVRTWRGNITFFVAPAANVTVFQATEDVTAAMRSIRRLGPRDKNNFGVVTQDKALENFNKITGMFFLVMIVLSSVALMVGGVGVVAIMMISVTERTREIGVRKALGAKRREILWQFLVEAATLTAIGGAIGMVLGGLISFIVSHTTPLPAEVPFWSIVAALTASVMTGVLFGIYPAARAARLDPIEALRHE